MATKRLRSDRAMIARQELAELITRQTNSKEDGICQTAIPQLELMRESKVSTGMGGVVKPILAIMVQGKKEVLLEEETYRYGAGQYLVVSVSLPLRAFVVEATPDKPYLGFKLNLDPTELCSIINQIEFSAGKSQNSTRALFVSDADASLIDCAVRLTRLLNTPQDIPFLAPLIIREIYYRLLIGEQSEAVRQIATPSSNMQRVATVIKQIETDYTKSLRVEELAKQANMSLASFYRHFKKVTSMSPLQYQKQLRLLEARQLMLAQNADAASAAYQVGYESPSQFSREYSRMFGASPIKDIKHLRTT